MPTLVVYCAASRIRLVSSSERRGGCLRAKDTWRYTWLGWVLVTCQVAPASTKKTCGSVSTPFTKRMAGEDGRRGLVGGWSSGG